MNLSKFVFAFLLVCFIASLPSVAQNRREVAIPDILGYQTLKCDFHMHTVFSDGDVWPTVRVQEAWLDGLDVIAITDHIEYLPHSQDIEADHNRSFEIAKPLADQMGVLLIRGTEITRKMPPGHLNAIFIKNANLIEREDWWEACVEAQEQGAFVFWNHPGWKAQQPEKTLWWSEHTRLLNAGILKGIEVFNYDEYYTEALKWADEKKLTMLANSDVHSPIGMTYPVGQKTRPMTLVFAVDKTEEAVKAALLDQRTAVYFNNTIMGDRRFLTPIFINSIKVMSQKIGLKNQDISRLQIHNSSDVPFLLKQRQPSVGFSCPDDILLEPHRTVTIELTGTSDEVAQMSVLKMFYEVTNLITKKGENLPVNIDVPNR
ncbi:Sb-PDE family phosphodiesterase [Gaoshiqia sediminis]|uniref:Sb-PDE family phosphodiesterase n=1 Tax=Gaoshiqia sediminis TaxID=2986998 RepID=A0AA41Y4H5_9BACT|nr:Sb-PDE family phosphodiesterase [Gaoshiqia sediminis]MCW0481680.1 Sb-PDE family phosphodiesterase [Gaoshiqia sediminis]